MVIVGAGGRLGAALARAYAADWNVTGFNHAQLDLGAPDAMRETLGALEFDALINCAAQTNVDRCEKEPEEAFLLNAKAPGILAEICADQGAHLLHISTDYVFEGNQRLPYTEEDATEPISVYGASKLAGERAVLAVDPGHLVARVSWVFGPDRPSFIDWIVQQAREKDEVAAVSDKTSTPSFTLDLAEMIQPLLADRTGGIIHVSNRGACTWQEYGQWALDCCRAEGMPLRAETVGAIPLASMHQFVARRPLHSVLCTEKFERLTGRTPRGWQEAVLAYVRMHLVPASAD